MGIEKYDIEKQHKLGKYHAIERICMILDEDSFREIGSQMTNLTDAFNIQKEQFPYDGVITGYGLINGEKVVIYSEDFTVIGGTLGKQHGKKIANAIRLAIENKCPVIGIFDSGGARIQEGIDSLAGYGEVFYYNAKASGYIPQIAVIAGNCAGGAAYSPGMQDFIFVIENISRMFVTGPSVLKKVTTEKVTIDELGGTQIHSEISGVAHFNMADERECYQKLRKLVELIPPCYEKNYVHVPTDVTLLKNYTKVQTMHEGLADIMPSQSNHVYDMRKVINEVIDTGTFIEVQEQFAKNVVIGLGRIHNMAVGVVASQPSYAAGVLDCDSSDKAARFVRYCDAFNLPIITLVDVPGYLPGTVQEQAGIVRHGAKLLYAYAESDVPKITVVLRKGYGGAYVAMGSKHLGADFVYAWPTAQIAVMGAEGATEILYRDKMKNMDEESRRIYKRDKTVEYNTKFMNPYEAAKRGYIDEVIKPEATRGRIYSDLLFLSEKVQTVQIEKKHGNIPL